MMAGLLFSSPGGWAWKVVDQIECMHAGVLATGAPVGRGMHRVEQQLSPRIHPAMPAMTPSPPSRFDT